LAREAERLPHRCGDVRGPCGGRLRPEDDRVVRRGREHEPRTGQKRDPSHRRIESALIESALNTLGLMSPKTLTGLELDLDDAPALESELFLVGGIHPASRGFFA